MAEFKLSYTGKEINEKLGKIDTLEAEIDQLSYQNADWNAKEGEPGHVLNRTHWVEGGMVEILPECQPEYIEDEGFFAAFPINIPAVGDICTINWNGVEYNCVAQDLSLMAPGAIGLGDGVAAEIPGTSGNGEPFAILIGEEDGQKVCMILPLDGTTEPTLSIVSEGETIHKLDNRYLDLDWLPTTQKGNIILPRKTYSSAESHSCDTSMYTEGQSLTVEYDGIKYECVIGNIDGIEYLGNLAVGGLSPNTGEPFLITLGTFKGVIFGDGGYHTLAIYDLSGNGIIYNTIPSGFIPSEVFENSMTKEEREKLAGIEAGANKVTVDSYISVSSFNPVSNRAVAMAIGENSSAIRTITNTLVGKRTDGTQYTIDDETVTAEDGAEIFNTGGGLPNKATGRNSHAEGAYTEATGDFSHAEGHTTKSKGYYSHTEGQNTETSGYNSHAEGNGTKAIGASSHAEGDGTTAIGPRSHTEGMGTIANGDCSHAEGYFTKATAFTSHAEGVRTCAMGSNSHAEGAGSNDVPDTITSDSTNDEVIEAWESVKFSLAKEWSSHVEGQDNLALGKYSHAEGEDNVAAGDWTHAEGYNTRAIGVGSHVEGMHCISSGVCSHAEGLGTIAHGEQHVEGIYNVEDTEEKYMHIIGYGTSTSRKNIHTVDKSGNAWYSGSVEGTEVIIKSPNGTRFKITVSDDGTLTATEVN